MGAKTQRFARACQVESKGCRKGAAAGTWAVAAATAVTAASLTAAEQQEQQQRRQRTLPGCCT